MPGVNCSIYGCGTCRSKKYEGTAIFQIPAIRTTDDSKADEKYLQWRKEFLNQITKSRVIDDCFRQMIKADRVYACEKHFKADEFETCKIFG